MAPKKRTLCKKCSPHGCVPCAVCGRSCAEVHASWLVVATGEARTAGICSACMTRFGKAGDHVFASMRLGELARNTPVSPTDYLKNN